MELKKRVGKRIKQLRIERGMKQSELSELVGIQSKTQSCIETGRNFPKADLIEKYAKIFKIDVSEVLYIGNIPKIEDDYLIALKNLINNVSKKEAELIYKIVKIIIDN